MVFHKIVLCPKKALGSWIKLIFFDYAFFLAS